jgi:hypothetical protein
LSIYRYLYIYTYAQVYVSRVETTHIHHCVLQIATNFNTFNTLQRMSTSVH